MLLWYNQTMKKETIYIKGDDISTKELTRQLNRERKSFLEFEKEKIRILIQIDDRLDNLQKSSRTSEINWRLEKLRRENER